MFETVARETYEEGISTVDPELRVKLGLGAAERRARTLAGAAIPPISRDVRWSRRQLRAGHGVTPCAAGRKPPLQPGGSIVALIATLAPL